MITLDNALTAIAAWCHANPGKPHVIPYRMLPQLGLNVITGATWAESQGLEWFCRTDGATVTCPAA